MKGRDIATLLLLAALWGASFMFIKVMLREMPPVAVVGYRLALGALGLIAFFAAERAWGAWRGQSHAPFPWRRMALPALILGVTNVIIPYLAITWGETAISSGDAAILNATVPLFTTILVITLGQRVSSEQTSWSKVLGVGVGFAGVAVLVSGSEPVAGVTSLDAWLGHGAVLVAAAAYAWSSLYARRVFTGLPQAATGARRTAWLGGLALAGAVAALLLA
jgi:drug/metabolite transporter (DMT)-like permease